VRAKGITMAWRAIPVFGSFGSGSTFTPNAAPFNAFQLFTNVLPSPLPNVD
jgi:hypothetical protein